MKTAIIIGIIIGIIILVVVVYALCKAGGKHMTIIEDIQNETHETL